MVYKFDIIGDFLIVVVSGNGYLYQVVAKVVKVVCDFVIINLGTNDQSWTRDKEERTLTFINLYRGLLEEVHRRSPDAKIICCLGVMGQLLCPAVETAVEKFKAEFPSAQIKTLVFPVQDEKDGIAADWHPSAATHEKMAVQFSEFIRKF